MSAAFDEALRISDAWFDVDLAFALADVAGAQRMRELLPGLNPLDVDAVADEYLRRLREEVAPTSDADIRSWACRFAMACVIAGVLTERDRE